MESNEFDALLRKVAQLRSETRADQSTRAQTGGAERLTVGELAERLSQRVLRQDAAVRAVASRLAVTLNGLAFNPDRPLGAFLFAGPPGVGKTELAHAIAEVAFGDRSRLIRLDMSEYSDSWALARLTGPQPGYAGFDRPESWLTTRVNAMPNCVVLADEIEKAAPEIHHAFLQILDAGRLTDGHGKAPSFANTIVVMTSNLGTREAEHASIGFCPDPSRSRHHRIDEAVRRALAPELLSRLDGVVHFDQLDEQAMRGIARHHLEGYLKRIRTAGWELSVADEIIDHLVSRPTDARYGFRHLERRLEQDLLPDLAGRQPGTYRAELEGTDIHWHPGT